MASRLPVACLTTLLIVVAVAAEPVELSLPFAHGFQAMVTFGPGEGGHTDQYNRHACDFGVQVGTPVHAMASGEVVFVKEDTIGPTGEWDDNNEIAIRHDDGHVALYLHLRKDGAEVAIGDQVHEGDLIGHSGNTGKSSGPHLHVDLRAGRRLGDSVLWRFREWGQDRPPRAGATLTSRNSPVGPYLAALEQLAELYSFCAEVDAREALVDQLEDVADPPRQLLARLRAIPGRSDFVKTYREAGATLVAHWQTDADAAVTAMTAAAAEGELAAALRIAVLGKRDFSQREANRAFRDLLKAHQRDPTFDDVEHELKPTLTLRAAIAKAVAAELAALGASPGKAARAWQKALRLYRRAADREQPASTRARLGARIDRLETRIEQLRAAGRSR